MKNKYKVVALVPLEFSVEGNSDSKEAIESVKNIFETCRDDKDYANIVFDGIVILRWAIHSSIWMRPKPQQKLK